VTGAAFARALLNPDLPVPEGLTDPRGRPSARRFAVYRNNVTVGLTAALAAGFPAVQKLVGEAFFAALAREYLRAHPPAVPMLSAFGGAFPAFLEGFPPVAGLPYLADVARLEVALVESYHAADAAPLTAAAFEATPPEALEGARLGLAPALRLIRSPHPVHTIWWANMRDPAVRPAPAAQDVLVLRPGHDPEPHLVPPASADFVAALLAGVPIGAAAGAAGPGHDLGSTLVLLLAGGGITGLEVMP
jgi:hypothetical protein